MIQNSTAFLPLTQVEIMLKKIFQTRPDIQKKILQPQELADYIQWLVGTFGSDPAYHISQDDVPFPSGSQMETLGKRILRDPTDTKALASLSSGYGMQQESQYMVTRHDISIGRMLRYMPSHWHKNNYFELYYPFSGECPIYFQNEVITLNPGTVLIVPPGISHASPCYKDDAVLVYYMIRSSTFDDVFWNQLPKESLMASFFRRALSDAEPNQYLQFETNEDGDIRNILYQLLQEFQENLPYRRQLMNSLMTTFFLLLLRRYEGTARLPRTENFYWKHEFSAILNYIQLNYATVKVSDLMTLFHYSDRQITRIVERCTGMTFSALVNKLKMDRAAVLLRRNELTIEQIAEATGYSSPSSFYRSFMNYHHVTPVEFRKAALASRRTE